MRLVLEKDSVCVRLDSESDSGGCSVSSLMEDAISSSTALTWGSIIALGTGSSRVVEDST